MQTAKATATHRCNTHSCNASDNPQVKRDHKMRYVSVSKETYNRPKETYLYGKTDLSTIAYLEGHKIKKQRDDGIQHPRCRIFRAGERRKSDEEEEEDHCE